jgi:glycosyltransferase involved in cell wall biosynthesis
MGVLVSTGTERLPELALQPSERPDGTAGRRRLLVVVPAFNEADTIEETLRGLQELDLALGRLGVDLSILVVDDGSSDGTADRAEGAGVHRFFRHRTNRGLGAAVRAGLKFARDEGFDILVKFDADLQHRPEDVIRIVQPVLEGEADVVYGNRFELIEYRMPLVRRIGNVAFSRLMRFLTGWPLKDSQPGIFAVGRDYLDVFSIPGDYNYTQQVLLDAYHKHMRFAHVPVSFRERRAGASFVTFGYPFRVLPQMLMVIASVKPLKVFAPIGFLFLLLACGVFTVQIGWWLTGQTSRPVENVNLVLGSGLFGLQTLFFGILAELIVQGRR